MGHSLSAKSVAAIRACPTDVCNYHRTLLNGATCKIQQLLLGNYELHGLQSVNDDTPTGVTMLHSMLWLELVTSFDITKLLVLAEDESVVEIQ